MRRILFFRQSNSYASDFFVVLKFVLLGDNMQNNLMIPTHQDALFLLNGAYRVNIKGESMRKTKKQ
ncbi:MAG: hypothetical protein U9N86_16125 [Bacteroidota bacterium]|nr:hypothetical protein [Bacteroidota bacterium]